MSMAGMESREEKNQLTVFVCFQTYTDKLPLVGPLLILPTKPRYQTNIVINEDMISDLKSNLDEETERKDIFCGRLEHRKSQLRRCMQNMAETLYALRRALFLAYSRRALTETLISKLLRALLFGSDWHDASQKS